MNKERNICIVGLGLLGGSYAMGLTDAGYTVTAVDVRPEAIRYALEKGIIAAGAVEDFASLLAGADAVVLGLYPHALVDWLRNNQKHLKPGALLTDVCGVKSGVVEEIQGFLRPDAEFIASHPMAGKETSGIFHADGALFRGAHYILTPDADVPQESIHLLEQLVTFMGCADVVFSDPAAHDERIAYTSQLMHVMALALCDQHLLFDSYGFEGGSFRGATRVAALDPKLWCELFWANRETLADLTDELIERLSEYSALLHGGDRAALLERLTVSSDRKKKFDTLRGLDESQKPLFK